MPSDAPCANACLPLGRIDAWGPPCLVWQHLPPHHACLPWLHPSPQFGTPATSANAKTFDARSSVKDAYLGALRGYETATALTELGFVWFKDPSN